MTTRINPTTCTLAQLGITNAATIGLQTFHSDARIENKKITFFEQTNVYADDMEAQQRIVLRFTINTCKKRGKRVPVPDSLVTVRLSILDGFDAATNMWGTSSTEVKSLELSAEEAWPLHLECAELRDAMINESGTWFRKAA